MSRIWRRFVVWLVALCALVFGPFAMTAIINPAVSWACDPGQVWDAAAQVCVLPPPPPPAPVPVTMCVGAPIPFVPMSWCFPVGG
jgi:hypothetical protein